MTDSIEATPHEMYQGVECGIGMAIGGRSQELAWLAKNPGKTIRDGVRAAGRASVWGGRCWKLWNSLTRSERLTFIAAAIAEAE